MTEEFEALMENDVAITHIIKAAFDKYNADKSGEIDINDINVYKDIIKNMLKELKAPKVNSSQLKNFLDFDMIETEKPGKINLKEFSQKIKFLFASYLGMIKRSKIK